MKYLEKLVMAHIKNSTPAKLDIHHYASRPNYSTSDTTAVVMHTVLTPW